MPSPRPDQLLLAVAAAHLLAGLIAALATLAPAAPILGVHPALKPMKFGLSIAAFLGAMALILPAISAPAWARAALAWTLCLTMIAEMAPICLQPLRHTTSHFNTSSPLNAALWQLMITAIVTATGAMLACALLATLAPLRGADGAPMHDLMATAWRAGLWMFLVAAISGFTMGGRLSHTVGAPDGGPGLTLLNWSISHGDLRISHFISLHALQSLPLFAALLLWLPLPSPARWAALILAILAHVLGAALTFAIALAGRPLP